VRASSAARIDEMPLNRTTKAILTALLLACGIWLGTNRQFYREALAGAFIAMALASVIIVHLRLRPAWLDALLILAGTLVLGAIDFRVLHFRHAIMAWLSFAGLSSLVIFGIRTIWAKDSERKLLALGYVPTVLFVVSEYFADDLLHWTAANHPKVLDLYLFSFDSSLGVQIPFVMGQAFSAWPWFRLAGVLFYIGLPIPIALIYAGQLLRVRERAIPAMVAFLATGPVGVIFYNLFPALGPVHLFGQGFPWHPLSMAQAAGVIAEPVAIAGPPNAIPSLHMAWVLLVWWYSRGLSWWNRSIALLFLSFTVLATLGTGEHYFIDLIVAFPFALLLASMCAFALKITDRSRLLAFCAGLAGTLGWFALLRHELPLFWKTPALPWSFCAATVIATLLCERQLRQHKGTTALEPPAASPALSSTT
jgi:PAP2 superfamily